MFWETGSSVCLKATLALCCSIVDNVKHILILFSLGEASHRTFLWIGLWQTARRVYQSVRCFPVRLPQVFFIMQSDIYNPRRHVGIHAEHISDVSSRDFPGNYPGEDNSWDLELFRKVKIPSLPRGICPSTDRSRRNCMSRLTDCRRGLSNSTSSASMLPSRTLSGGYS